MMPILNETISQRNALVESHIGLVRAIARSIHRLLPPAFELDDLIQSGLIGLIQAAERFDPSVHPSFDALARFRVRGAILDSIRRREYRNTVHGELPDLPSESESIEDAIAQREQAKRITTAVNELPPREKQVIELRYRQELTMAGVGAALKLRKTRAIQLHHRAICRLQQMLLAAA
jgi:RNA polymerase sigma factor for flagellar operon FliA